MPVWDDPELVNGDPEDVKIKIPESVTPTSDSYVDVDSIFIEFDMTNVVDIALYRVVVSVKSESGCEYAEVSRDFLVRHDYFCVSFPPVCNITSISPSPAVKGETVFFNGTAIDPDTPVVAYNWTSSIDGHLSNSLNFSSSDLSVGIHTIYFSAQDYVMSCYDVWSEADSVTLIITEEAIINQNPVASISQIDFSSAVEGSPVTFDASASSDVDDDELEYRWDFNSDGTWDTGWSNTTTITNTWYDDWIGMITLEVSDGELTDSDTIDITVQNVAPTGTISGDVIDENGTATINGVISDPGINDTFDVTIEWGDGEHEIVSYPAGTTVFSKNHQYLDDDPSGTSSDDYTVTVTVTDDDGGVGTESSVVTVNNIAPEIISLSSPIDPIAVNEPITISSDFIDVGTLDTHTVSIDWGDSSVDAMELSVSSVSADQPTHSYLDAGVYRITVTVIDDDDGSDTKTSEQYVVVYDADAGFVTGGGWIYSPLDAYITDPTLTGKATFGFVSKYKKGAIVPTGNTEFQFQVADLTFKSTSYEWLVIAGSKAKYKGIGTINGEGEYTFMLSAIDADLTPSTDVDLFRMKIWNETAVIYDNQIEALEDADPTTAIGGGSIVIHQEK
ncbi:PKD domain-containing protein [Methanolobus sediminis]|uniref:PKD domain-containing protein n=1 Tax=Methanolobus sediminis TaxID=3072978 RepID=A0AA51YLN2_9EURY|nr:PKD domain-containing protein [Methanolobus sediminis]WMW25154.1 PKD domain-containing protein [Methanolobus sediminis]